jgi:hypothetical protein
LKRRTLCYCVRSMKTGKSKLRRREGLLAEREELEMDTRE